MDTTIILYILLALIVIGCLIGLGVFVKAIIDKKNYDAEELPDLEEIDVEEDQLPDLELEESVFGDVEQEFTEKVSAELFAEITKRKTK